MLKIETYTVATKNICTYPYFPMKRFFYQILRFIFIVSNFSSHMRELLNDMKFMNLRFLSLTNAMMCKYSFYSYRIFERDKQKQFQVESAWL